MNIITVKGQEKLLLGKESPAPTVYKPLYDKVIKREPQFKIGTEKWFHDETEQGVWKSVPHFYQTITDKFVHKNGPVAFDKSLWF